MMDTRNFERGVVLDILVLFRSTARASDKRNPGIRTWSVTFKVILSISSKYISCSVFEQWCLNVLERWVGPAQVTQAGGVPGKHHIPSLVAGLRSTPPPDSIHIINMNHIKFIKFLYIIFLEVSFSVETWGLYWCSQGFVKLGLKKYKKLNLLLMKSIILYDSLTLYKYLYFLI